MRSGSTRTCFGSVFVQNLKLKQTFHLQVMTGAKVSLCQFSTSRFWQCRVLTMLRPHPWINTGHFDYLLVPIFPLWKKRGRCDKRFLPKDHKNTIETLQPVAVWSWRSGSWVQCKSEFASSLDPRHSPHKKPFARSGHMVQNKLYWDANNAVPDCVICITALFIPYHVTGSCKRPIWLAWWLH